jgi:hypothetical protein
MVKRRSTYMDAMSATSNRSRRGDISSNIYIRMSRFLCYCMLIIGPEFVRFLYRYDFNSLFLDVYQAFMDIILIRIRILLSFSLLYFPSFLSYDFSF